MSDKWKEKALEVLPNAYGKEAGLIADALRTAYQEGARDMRDRAVEATYKLSEARGYTTSGLFSDAIAALPLSPDDGEGE